MGERAVIDRVGFGALVGLLVEDGYTVIAPSVADDAIVLAEVDSADGIATGWRDVQDGGFYRLEPRPDGAMFGYANGPQSWRRYLSPPRTVAWTSDGVAPAPAEKPFAFIGVRPCDLAAIDIQDAVFSPPRVVDPAYARRRGPAFMVAVNCTEPGGTCFCTSMGTGPGAPDDASFDLCLTELTDEPHRFVVQPGSPAGEALLDRLPHAPASPADVVHATELVEQAAGRMGRAMDVAGLAELLARSTDHPRWDDVAARCLTCGNCTLVCPTCFCTAVEDTTDLDGRTTRERRWDSCFTMDFSYIHGGSVRGSALSRYRQWLTHKLGTWHDQFGQSGCVGCGRCITWCPVGIDLTEEVAALRGDR